MLSHSRGDLSLSLLKSTRSPFTIDDQTASIAVFGGPRTARPIHCNCNVPEPAPPAKNARAESVLVMTTPRPRGCRQMGSYRVFCDSHRHTQQPVIPCCAETQRLPIGRGVPSHVRRRTAPVTCSRQEIMHVLEK